MKRRSITIAPCDLYKGEILYRVLGVSNSLDYNPDDRLTKTQVAELCSLDGWTVIIKRYGSVR